MAWGADAQNRACDGVHGEIYLQGSSEGQLGQCRAWCERVTTCKSITYYPNSKWCSLWSTGCTARKFHVGAVSASLPSRTAGTTPTPIQTQPPTTIRLPMTWVSIAKNKECDEDHGEIYLRG